MIVVDSDRQLMKLRNRLKLTSNNEDELLKDFLDTAKDEIMARRYPFGDFPDGLDIRYANLQIEIAIVMWYNRYILSIKGD